MRKLWLVLILLLAGCVSPSVPSPISSPISSPIASPLADAPAPGGYVLVPGSPQGAPAPSLTVIVRVYDEATGVPLEGRLAWVEGEPWREPTEEDFQIGEAHEFQLGLDGAAAGWIVVMRPGYERWRLRLRYELQSAQVLELPVRMRREVGRVF